MQIESNHKCLQSQIHELQQVIQIDRLVKAKLQWLNQSFNLIFNVLPHLLSKIHRTQWMYQPLGIPNHHKRIWFITQYL